MKFGRNRQRGEVYFQHLLEFFSGSSFNLMVIFRWKNVETHDIVVNCARLLVNSGGSGREYHQNSIYEPKSTFNCEDLLGE